MQVSKNLFTRIHLSMRASQTLTYLTEYIFIASAEYVSLEHKLNGVANSKAGLLPLFLLRLGRGIRAHPVWDRLKGALVGPCHKSLAQEILAWGSHVDAFDNFRSLPKDEQRNFDLGKDKPKN